MITKLEVLELIDENEVIGIGQLASYFGMSYNWAKLRLKRLRRLGLVEPLGVERGRWVLSIAGIDKLDYLRRRGNGKRRAGKTGSSGG